MPSATKLFTLALTGAIASSLSLDTAARAAPTELVQIPGDPALSPIKTTIYRCREYETDKSCDSGNKCVYKYAWKYKSSLGFGPAGWSTISGFESE